MVDVLAGVASASADRADGSIAPGTALVGGPVRRGVASGVAVVVLAVMVVSSLPASPLRAALDPLVRPVVQVTGLQQNWNMFAPRPLARTLTLRVDLEHVDGTVSRWEVPDGGLLLGTYRFHRWRKWAWSAAIDGRDAAHAGAIHHALAEARADGRPPVTIARLWRLTASQPPAGSGVPLDRDPLVEEELLLALTLAEGADGAVVAP